LKTSTKYVSNKANTIKA